MTKHLKAASSFTLDRLR